MYKVQYKQNNVLEGWTTMGIYGTEQEAIANASKKKRLGAVITRIIDQDNKIVFIH
jgi:hypothetical protein